MNKYLTIVVAGIAVVAVAGVGTGVAAMKTQPSTRPLQQQVDTLQTQVKTLTTKAATLTTKATMLTIETSALKAAAAQAASTGNVNALKSDIRNLKLCVPQLQQEVDGLNVQTSWQGSAGWLTSAYLDNPTIVSADCSKLLKSTSSHGN
jgi:outer membrane murein-binding lipoprotein Lpp